MITQRPVVYALLVMSFFYSTSCASVTKNIDPFSKITISSISAYYTKNQTKSGSSHVSYQDNVRVVFADNSTVMAHRLDIEINRSHQSNQSNAIKKPSHGSICKHIAFDGNVCIVSGQREAQADKATFDMLSKKCMLEGNVKMRQIKKTPHDIPVSISGEKAEFYLDTGEFNILGSAKDPVCTTIVLEDNAVFKKKMRLAQRSINKKDDNKNSDSSSRRSS